MPALSEDRTRSRDPEHHSSLTAKDMGGSASAKVGGQIEVRLSSPRGVAPEYRVSWAAQPTLTGEALRFLDHEVENPPKDVDGGSSSFRYRFEAVAAGTTTISIDPVEPGEDAQQGPWTAELVVGD